MPVSKARREENQPSVVASREVSPYLPRCVSAPELHRLCALNGMRFELAA
jgi:hypothetical protein